MTQLDSDELARVSASAVALADAALDGRLTAADAPGTLPALSVRGVNTEIGGAFTSSSVPLVPDAIALTGGFPGADILPIAELANAYAAVLSRPDAGITALQYHMPFGTDELRSWIAADQETDLERVLVTNGALHSVAFAVEALIDPGDLALVEDPTFPFALRLLRYYGARTEAIPTDAGGLDVEALEARLKAGARPKLLYLVPDFHNPTTVTLSAERRTRILELALHYGFVVISDNPYAKLRFAGSEVPDFEVDSEHVVRASTFSKVFGPGLRIGWAVAPTWLRDAFVRTRISSDQHAGLLTQRVIEHLVTTPGLVEAVLTSARAQYAERASTLHAALASALGDRFEAREPDGGLFLWARVPGADLGRALDVARARGLDFTHGASFDPTRSGRHRDWARFAYSNATPSQLEVAAGRFAAAVAAVES